MSKSFHVPLPQQPTGGLALWAGRINHQRLIAIRHLYQRDPNACEPVNLTFIKRTLLGRGSGRRTTDVRHKSQCFTVSDDLITVLLYLYVFR